MKIDKKTYLISKNNHYGSSQPKKQIVIGVSLRKDNNHIHRLQHKDHGTTKKWNTYTISRDGEIFQHYDDKHYSDFLGIKIADKQSISIVLENMGCLYEPTKIHKEFGQYVNWLNEYVDKKFVVNKRFLGYDYWEGFPEIQFKSLISLCSYLCEKHKIPKEFIDFQHYNKNIVKYTGISFRSNYIENSSDINPLFNIEKINSELNKHIL